jgi:diguanylate cyclase (GGDEF)-like protein
MAAVGYAIIFTFDLMLPLGVAGGVPYVAVVLLGLWLPQPSQTYLLAVVSSVLTILGFYFSPEGGILWVVLTNRGLALFAIWASAFLVVVTKRSKRDFVELREGQELLKFQAATDPLTGARNRRSFLEQGEKELRRARRHKRPLSVLMMDVDHFKRINDTYGHAVGDKVLTCLVSECRGVLREADILGRLGGEEFAVVLTEDNPAAARDVAERLRRTLEDLEIETSGGTLEFTVSIGVSGCQTDTESLDEALKRADKALYAAKTGGRNRVVVESRSSFASVASHRRTSASG